jgi:uncharacterized membrane protein
MNTTRWRTAVVCCAIALLGLGIFFRFAYLDRKVYGLDESFTSLRISGFSEAEVVQDLSRTRVLGLEEFQKYQRYSPERSVLGTVTGLASEEPQHPPLYYVLARLWAGCLGDAVAVTRALPALISLLAFPCMYWLCRELFPYRVTIAWLAVALLAVSPFHVAYAQEARQYSLWTVTILLSSAALLRALRVNTWSSWLLYAVTVVISFYTFLFSVLVVAGHALYVAAVERFRLNQTSIRFVTAGVLGLAPFVPWLVNMAGNWSRVQHTTNWGASEQVPAGERLVGLVRGWARHAGRPFFDLNVLPDSPAGQRMLQVFFTGLCVVVVAVALIHLWRTTDLRAWFFVFTLIGVPAAGLVLQDLLLKGQSGGASLVGRYVIPCFLGFELAVAHLLASALAPTDGRRWPALLGRSIFIVLLAGGLFSCVTYAGSREWWNKGGVDYLQANGSASDLINASGRPLVISDCDTWGLMFASHMLDPHVHLLVKPHCFSCKVVVPRDLNPDLAKVSEGFTDVFLFPAPSEELVARIERQRYKPKRIPISEYDDLLWKVEGPP